MRISQRRLEHILHKQHVLNAVKDELEEHLPDLIEDAVRTLKDWLDTETWPSKQLRQDAIRHHDLRAIVLKLLANIVLSCKEPLPLVSIASMTSLSDELDKLDSIHLACEVIAILRHTDAYSVLKAPNGTYVVVSQLEPSEELTKRIRLSCYLPPMLEKPEKLESNNDSALKTIKSDKVILGGVINQHSGNISLDVINTMNSNEYELDEVSIQEIKPFHRDILNPEELKELDLEEQEQYHKEYDNYTKQIEQFQYLAELLKGRTLYFAHKPDKRGRIYTQGYHFSPMGSSYEKSCINLAKKELITGDL